MKTRNQTNEAGVSATRVKKNVWRCRDGRVISNQVFETVRKAKEVFSTC